MLPFFLARAREWRDLADELRARGVPAGDPLLSVWREAAWCELLLARGRYGAIVARLRDVTGLPLPEPVLPTCRADVLLVAADVFARLRSAVAARYPTVSANPVAA